jgi:predicted RNA-binding Zn-ribbon protein involved in translation (DUF1610 family)
MESSTKKWIAAGKAFGKNSKTKFSCPECQVGELLTKDEIVGKTIDRYIYCNNCGKWNVLMLSLKLNEE